MRNFRKLISLLLAVLLILPVGTLSFTATASSDSIKVGDTITLGTYTQSAIKDSDGNVTDYKTEPIEWIVLNITDGKALLLSKKIIDGRAYNHTSSTVDGYYGNNYAHSDIRKWLIGDFYNTAFTSAEQNAIVPTELDNSATSNRYSSESTTDNVFLLSKWEAQTYANKYYSTTATDYAYSNGFTARTSTESCNQWRLRTAGSNYYELWKVEIRWGSWTVYYNWYDDEITPISGIRPALNLDLEKYEASNLSEESQAYIQQHINFVNSTKYSNLMHKATFYDSIWQYESTSQNFTALTGWKVLGDIGKVASLNFSNLLITENPYDAILADILSNYTTDNAILSVCSSVLDVVFEIDSDCDKLMKILQSSDEWDDSIDVSKVKETIKQLLGESKKSLIDGVFFSTKEYKLKEKHAQVYEILTKCFSKIDASKWNSLFSNLNNISTIIGYINSATDIVEVIFDAYQQYIIAKALVTSNIDVLGSLVSAGYYLPPIAQDLLVESTKKYLEVLDYDSAFGAVCNYMICGSVKNVYEIFKGSLKTVIYTGIANLFDVSAGSINAIIFTFNTTYTILDSITGLGDMSKTFLLLDSAAMLEDALCEVTENIANNLKSKCTLTNAARLDACWGLLQSVEGYCYSSLSNYISGLKKTYTTSFVIKTGIGSFFTSIIEAKKLSKNLNDANAAIQVAVMFDNEWKNANCHGESSSSSKTVSVKCPTDVYVYDENNELMLTIINNTIEKLNFKFSAIVDGTEKIFALPNDQNYSIRIVGTDTGTMTYSIFDLSEINIINFTEYENLALRKDCVYEGILYNDTNDTYDLEMTKTGICKHTDNNNDGTCDICGKDMTENCKCICHSKNIFVQFVWEILCAVFRFLDIDVVRYCDCGAAHW